MKKVFNNCFLDFYCVGFWDSCYMLVYWKCFGVCIVSCSEIKRDFKECFLVFNYVGLRNYVWNNCSKVICENGLRD